VADLSLIPEAAWSEARRRAEVIRPLADRDQERRHGRRKLCKPVPLQCAGPIHHDEELCHLTGFVSILMHDVSMVKERTALAD